MLGSACRRCRQRIKEAVAKGAFEGGAHPPEGPSSASAGAASGGQPLPPVWQRENPQPEHVHKGEPPPHLGDKPEDRVGWVGLAGWVLVKGDAAI